MRVPNLLVLTFTISILVEAVAFSPSKDQFSRERGSQLPTHETRNSFNVVPIAATALTSSSSSSQSVLLFSQQGNGDVDGTWNGEVVPQGTIRGCSITPVGETEPFTEWVIAIDGVEADLGRFSEALYKQIINDAKKQRFQGFRPGTIPPHLQPTYRAFSMDECARETLLEAMQQNNIRPFSDARMKFKIEHVSIPPAPVMNGGKRNKRKSSKKNAKKGRIADNEDDIAAAAILENDDPSDPIAVNLEWQKFETMDEAIKAGWKPGQSFSFVATNVKGQKVLNNGKKESARPLGMNY